MAELDNQILQESVREWQRADNPHAAVVLLRIAQDTEGITDESGYVVPQMLARTILEAFEPEPVPRDTVVHLTADLLKAGAIAVADITDTPQRVAFKGLEQGYDEYHFNVFPRGWTINRIGPFAVRRHLSK